MRHRSAAWLCVVCLALGASAASPEAAPPVPELQPAAVDSLANAWIRVAVVRNAPQVDLAIHGRFRITALHTADALQEGSQLPHVTVRANQQGILMGEQAFPMVGVRVEPTRDASIDLNGHRLRGVLEIVRQADLTLLVINHVDLEDYLQGVLSKEAPDYWPREALKTLAIAARTYALYQRLAKPQVDYDVTSDVLSQVYGGRSSEKWRTNHAVSSTRGLILTYNGQIFPSFYHSTCGGLTEHASVMGPYDLPPLRGGIACSFCLNSPFYRWEKRFTKADVAWALKQRGYGSVGGGIDGAATQRSPTGRVAEVSIRGVTRTITLKGYDFRALFGFDQLRSLAFTVEPQGDAFVLHGGGWGHGVGMCQWGMAELARRGLSAREILSFYYPGTELARVGESVIQPIVVPGGQP